MSRGIVIIPARYASSRFPGKPLALIAGKSMIQRVVEQAKSAELVDRVVVATDDERIAEHVGSFGGEWVMTSVDHQSGTDRIAEAVSALRTEADLIVNVQGDEPFIRAEQIDSLVRLFSDASVDIGTLVSPIEEESVLADTDRVKCVRAESGRALYFSRAAVPHVRDGQRSTPAYLHLGMYAYRARVLKEISQLPPSQLEKTEALEQLRWLENGYSIQTSITDFASIGIDRAEDVDRAEAWLKSQ